MKQIKRNKSKVWRKCYGKVFIARKAFYMAQMSIISAQGQAQLGAMLSYGAPVGVVMASKAVAVAQAAVNLAQAMSDASHEMNKGFLIKGVVDG